MAGASIAELIHRDDLTIDGVSVRRFVATVRGWQGFPIFEGKLEADGATGKRVIRIVRGIMKRIDAGDESVFLSGGGIGSTDRDGDYWKYGEEISDEEYYSQDR